MTQNKRKNNGIIICFKNKNPSSVYQQGSIKKDNK